LIAVVMYCGYGDESRDGKGTAVYAVAGIFGHENDWKAIRRPWKKRLGGRVFHAVDCENGRGSFTDLRETERKELYRDLVQLFVDSKLLASAQAIDVAAYKTVFTSEFEHAPYLWLFGNTVTRMAAYASLSVRRQHVKVTFDRNNVQHNAALLYDFIRRSKKNQSVAHLLSDEIAFATKETLGIQVADLVAREVMKRLEDDLLNKRRVRASYAALRACKRCEFKFLRENDFVEAKTFLNHLPNSDKFSMKQYREWVADSGLHDCLTNRVHFIEANAESLGYRPKS
jgi:hypothetical protein